MIFKKVVLQCQGGLSLGSQLAEVTSPSGEIFKVEHKWANDYDPFACQTFRKNICPNDPDSVIEGDVEKINIEALPSIDAFSFGFHAMIIVMLEKKKDLMESWATASGVKVLKTHRPKWFMAENAGGLENANAGEALKILTDLEKSGYNLTPHLYKFHEYGVPQARHRIIIVGIRKDLGLQFRVPEPTHNADNYVTSELLKNRLYQ